MMKGVVYMSPTLTIRREQAADHTAVETLIRRAFWNLYVPGCNEHYLAHIMRTHADFVPELDLVLQMDESIIGSILYTRATLIDAQGQEKPVLTFGPVCIAPEHQRKGYGKQLMHHSFACARALGYDTIVITGDPGNYVSSGFRSCKAHNVSLSDGTFPTAMLVKTLQPGALDGRRWTYRQSPLFDHIDQNAFQAFDRTFAPMEKRTQPSQEVFSILSHSVLR